MIKINEKYPYQSIYEYGKAVTFDKLNVGDWTLWMMINHTSWTWWLQYSYHFTKNVIRTIWRKYVTIDRYIIGNEYPFHTDKIPLDWFMSFSHSIEDLLSVFEAITTMEVSNTYENSPEFIDLNKKAYEDIYFKVQDDPLYFNVVEEYFKYQEFFNKETLRDCHYKITAPFWYGSYDADYSDN